MLKGLKVIVLEVGVWSLEVPGERIGIRLLASNNFVSSVESGNRRSISVNIIVAWYQLDKGNITAEVHEYLRGHSCSTCNPTVTIKCLIGIDVWFTRPGSFEIMLVFFILTSACTCFLSKPPTDWKLPTDMIFVNSALNRKGLVKKKKESLIHWNFHRRSLIVTGSFFTYLYL